MEKTHHSANHDDFGPNIFLHKEDMHEAQEVHGQSEAVEHACPDECLCGQGEAKYDGYDEH